MIRNARVSLAVISLMFPVQKLPQPDQHTPPTETRQTLPENVRCGPTPG